MKISLINSEIVDMGDLDWSVLNRYGQVTEYRRLAPNADLAALIGDSDIVVGSPLNIDSRVLDACPNLKLIDATATGYQTIDLEAARAHGVAVCNVPKYSRDAVAQHAFALLLSLTNKVAIHNEAVKKGDWCKAYTFCNLVSPITELAGKTLCVFGYGDIGRQVLRIAQAFGMKTLAVAHHPETAPAMEGVCFVDTDTAFSTADVLALTCPLTQETRHLVNARRLALMKPSAFLINTSRGPLVDEDALADALNGGKLAGYGADVLSVEPMAPDCRLPYAKNAVITSHIAWCATETRARIIAIVAQNIESWQNGGRLNRIV